MSIAQRFIDRPILATVLSALVVIAGLLALRRLPVSEYPEVVPPGIQVQAVFPGASPEVVAETVAGPLEQQMTGIAGMLYQSSQSTPDGAMALTLTFAIGTDLEDALVEVQNRIAQAQPRLPEEVRRLGITARKSTGDMALVVHLLSPDDRHDMLYLANYARLRVKDALARIPGVGEVAVFGAGTYSMRAWLDPERMAARGLVPADVVHAIRQQNVQVAAGVLGAPPDATGASHQLTITAQGRLLDEQEFGAVVVKSEGGRLVRLRDVARLELGADSYALRSLLDNRPAVALAVFQAPGSNAIALSDQVRAAMAGLERDFPPGVAWAVAYDPTVFVRDSIAAVVTTLLEAVVLVVIVVVLFLQTWRASIIPLAAVPVSLIGTFAVMHLCGFSINALSLFGLVLAIGIVVDDAIVVVENVERHIARGLAPRDATRRAMREVSGPIIATALVLCAVFIPTAFISGLTGRFYQQFALTIAISTVISAFNSLTLSPALAAVLLPAHGAPRDRLSRGIDRAFGWLFRPFNRFFAAAARRYVWSVARVLRLSAIALILYGGLLALTAFAFQRTPTGFVPAQDKQYLVAIAAQLPDGAALDRTEAVVRRMTDLALQQPGVADVVAFPGLSIAGFTRAPNAAVLFLNLAPFAERREPGRDVGGIAAALNQAYAAIPEAFVLALPPPPILGLGNTGGFKLQLQDIGGLGLEELARTTRRVIAAARALPELEPTSVFSGFTMDVPRVALAVDRTKAEQQGVPVAAVYETLQGYLGSLYANDFARFGRSYQVTVQAEAAHRLDPAAIGRLQVRNAAGAMVPLATLVEVRETSGPDRVAHYDTFPSAELLAAPAPGSSSDQAKAALAALLARELPAGIDFAWTELAYQQELAGDTALYVFPLCVLLVLLVLAAFYESWSLPLAVILIVPMCLLSALAGVWLLGGDNNILTQIGLIVLVGLACKNAILIVEFAKDEEDRGAGPVRAALRACLLRLRPILMTSLAFILGVWPLVTAAGAGAENRSALGVAVFAGMIGVTCFGLLLTPVFYVAIRRRGRRRPAADRHAAPMAAPAAG